MYSQCGPTHWKNKFHLVTGVHCNIPISFTGLTPRTNDMSHQLFTPWSAWSACSKTCGVGFRARRRSCINPTLFPRLCSGISIQHHSCFDRACPGKSAVRLSGWFSTWGFGGVQQIRSEFYEPTLRDEYVNERTKEKTDGWIDGRTDGFSNGTTSEWTEQRPVEKMIHEGWTIE